MTQGAPPDGEAPTAPALDDAASAVDGHASTLPAQSVLPRPPSPGTPIVEDASSPEPDAGAREAGATPDARAGALLDRLQPGVVVNDRYEIVRVVGRGGLGQVYKARHRNTAEDVALKVPHMGAAETPEWKQRLIAEREQKIQIKHEHVARLLDADEWNGLPYSVTEWVEGTTLAARGGDLGLGLIDACVVVRQMASALGALHDKGLVHCDIKPENIVVSDHDGAIHAKLIDLGFARPFRESALASRFADKEPERRRLLFDAPAGGTPEYESPRIRRQKLLHQKPSAEPADDLWSLGVTLYWLVTRGCFPFRLDRKVGLDEIIDPEKQATIPTDLPPALAEILRRALQKEQPGFVAAAEMADSLQRAEIVLRGLSSRLGESVERDANPLLRRVSASPGDYPTIEEALEGAPDATTVMIESGLYRTRLTLEHAVTLTAATGATVELVGSGSVAVSIRAEGVILCGLTIRTGGGGERAAAVEIQAGNVTIDRCTVESPAGDAVRVHVGKDAEKVTLVRCPLQNSLTGILVGAGKVVLDHCIMRSNEVGAIAKDASLDVHGGSIEASTLAGILAMGTARVKLDRVKCTNTRRGHGFSVLDQARLQARACESQGAAQSGAHVSGGATLVLEAGRYVSNGFNGVLVASGTAEITGAALTGNKSAGLWVRGGTAQGTSVSLDGNNTGVATERDGTATLSRCELVNNRYAAVLARDTSRQVLEDCVASGRAEASVRARITWQSSRPPPTIGSRVHVLAVLLAVVYGGLLGALHVQGEGGYVAVGVVLGAIVAGVAMVTLHRYSEAGGIAMSAAAGGLLFGGLTAFGLARVLVVPRYGDAYVSHGALQAWQLTMAVLAGSLLGALAGRISARWRGAGRRRLTWLAWPAAPLVAFGGAAAAFPPIVKHEWANRSEFVGPPYGTSAWRNTSDARRTVRRLLLEQDVARLGSARAADSDAVARTVTALRELTESGPVHVNAITGVSWREDEPHLSTARAGLARILSQWLLAPGTSPERVRTVLRDAVRSGVASDALDATIRTLGERNREATSDQPNAGSCSFGRFAGVLRASPGPRVVDATAIAEDLTVAREGSATVLASAEGPRVVDATAIAGDLAIVSLQDGAVGARCCFARPTLPAGAVVSAPAMTARLFPGSGEPLVSSVGTSIDGCTDYTIPIRGASGATHHSVLALTVASTWQVPESYTVSEYDVREGQRVNVMRQRPGEPHVTTIAAGEALVR